MDVQTSLDRFQTCGKWEMSVEGRINSLCNEDGVLMKRRTFIGIGLVSLALANTVLAKGKEKSKAKDNERGDWVVKGCKKGEDKSHELAIFFDKPKSDAEQLVEKLKKNGYTKLTIHRAKK
jgi:hypothetical protein